MCLVFIMLRGKYGTIMDHILFVNQLEERTRRALTQSQRQVTQTIVLILV